MRTIAKIKATVCIREPKNKVYTTQPLHSTWQFLIYYKTHEIRIQLYSNIIDAILKAPNKKPNKFR
jgi:hypothetical protein